MNRVKLRKVAQHNHVIDIALLLRKGGQIALLHSRDNAVVSRDFLIVPCPRLNRRIGPVDHGREVGIELTHGREHLGRVVMLRLDQIRAIGAGIGRYLVGFIKRLTDF
jgi:hypothetical protein